MFVAVYNKFLQVCGGAAVFVRGIFFIINIMSAGVESELEKIIGNGDAGDNKVANDDTDDSNVKPKVKTKTIEKKSGD